MAADQGGALFNFTGTFNLTKVLIPGIVAEEGGGVYNTGGSVSVSADTRITGNIASLDPNTHGV